MRFAWAIAALIVIGPSQIRADAATEGTLAIQLCGRLAEHTAATAGQAGRLTIGSRTYVIASATTAGNAGVTVEVGRDLCVEASAGRTSSQLVRYTFFPIPSGTTCGTVFANAGQTVNMGADFGLLRIPRQEGVREPRPGERVCYVTAVSAAGDLSATGEDPVDTTLEREWVAHCGTVSLYQRSTATEDGRIQIGSQPFTIARGVAYTGDPAGDRTDRTAVGSQMCLRGVRGDRIALVEYLTRPMDSGISGRAVEYVPPSGGPGLATLSYRTQLRMRIPPAVDASGDIARQSLCYSVGVDAAGDMIATGIIACGPGGVAGAAASPMGTAVTATTATPGASPTTSASPERTAGVSPERTDGAVAVASPPPSDPAPANAALALLAAAAAFIGIVTYALWRRARR